LAALHFNYNANREAKVGDNGQPRMRLFYRKQKYGEATVKERKIPINSGKSTITFHKQRYYSILCIHTTKIAMPYRLCR